MLSSLNKCKNESSRRDLLKYITSMSLGVNFFNSPLTSDTTKNSNRKKVVRIFLIGGISHLDSFDPKPQTPEVMGDTKVIKTNTGETISSFFPEIAKRMDKLTLIRSMVSPEGDHERGRYIMRTSYPLLGTIKHPSFGVWMHRLNGAMNKDLPPSVSIRGGGGAGFLDSSYDPFKINHPHDPMRGLLLEDPTSEENIELLKLMADVRRNFHKDYKSKSVNAYAQFYNDSIKLMQSQDLKAFNLELEDKASKSKYNIKNGSSFLLARRLLESGVQSVDIGVQTWDHHYTLWEENNFPTMSRDFDKAFSTFLDDLHSRNILKDTVVTVNTEFGRTPKISIRGGRDHHRRAYFSLIGGAGVKKGFVYGKTDDKAFKVIENPVSPSDFNATLAKLCGLDLNKEIYSPDNRPFTVARNGKVIDGILT